jgi:hypothetical protein
MFAVVQIRLYDPKTGFKFGLSAPKRGYNWDLGCITLNPKTGSNVGYRPQNGVIIGLYDPKLGLWSAFGYTRFWVYTLFGT